MQDASKMSTVSTHPKPLQQEAFMRDRFVCPVCGYPGLAGPPRDEGGGGSYEICDSCGFEFGFTDEDQGFTYEEWRTRWTQAGMPWRSEGIVTSPREWDPCAQLKKVIDT